MKKFNIFVAVCFCLSFCAAGVFRLSGLEYGSLIGSMFASFYMLFPLLSVIITQLITREELLSDIGLSFKLNWWWALGILIMPVLCMASVFISSFMPGVEFSTDTDLVNTSVEAMKAQGLNVGPRGFIGITMLSGIFAACTVNALFAFGEEAAWRGFLTECLSGWGFWKKSLLVGFVWGLWHMPLILMGHNYPSHPVLGVFMMTAFCMLMAPIMQLVRDRSGSAVAAAMAHGSVNAIAGIAIVLLNGYNDLLCGMSGLAGFIILAIADTIIFICYKPQ